MDKMPAWGRVEETKGRRLPETAENRLGAILKERKRYPRWTTPMVEALKRTREQGRKWFQLYDKIADVKTLKEAWGRIEQRTKGGARTRGAGIDGVTVAEFSAIAPEQLTALEGKLKKGEYRPAPVKRHWIPKPGSDKKRPLGLPTVADRVVQEAARGVIEPIWEEQFLDGSHGFRPGRSTDSACRMMETYLEQGKVWIVDADISGCFDNIPHQVVIDLMARRIADGKALSLIESMLKAGILEGWSLKRNSVGTPQGGVISPLLCNITLHELDTRLEAEGMAYVRYADDFVLLCKTRREAERARDTAAQALAPLGLQLHPEKTRIVHLDEGFDFLGWHYKGRQRWPRDKSVKSFRRKAKAKTRRNRPGSAEAICDELEPLLRGFFNYFRNGNSAGTFSQCTSWLRRRLRSILRKRQYGKSGISSRQDHFLWPNAFFEEKGLFDLVAHLEMYREKHLYSLYKG
jgi:RNA-directed DNA polymerase